MTAQLPERFELTGPQALRAVAHEARMRAVTEIYAHGPTTATRLARLVGVTPSAMSYHLRALARWGVIVPVASDDGRERRWGPAAKSFRLGADDGSVDRTQAGMAVDAYVEELRRTAAGFVAQAPAGRRPGMTLSHLRHRITAEQAQRLAAEVEALLARYEAEADPDDPTLGSWDLFGVVVPPIDPATDSSG